jgi:iron complex outermembrane receptor protein
LGKQYFDLANTIEQKAYSLFNSSIGINCKNWSLSLWGRNLSDKKYILYAYDFGGIHLGEPQLLGATFGIKI